MEEIEWSCPKCGNHNDQKVPYKAGDNMVLNCNKCREVFLLTSSKKTTPPQRQL